MESNGIPVDSMDRNRSRINRKKSEKSIQSEKIGKNRFFRKIREIENGSIKSEKIGFNQKKSVPIGKNRKNWKIRKTDVKVFKSEKIGKIGKNRE